MRGFRAFAQRALTLLLLVQLAETAAFAGPKAYLMLDVDGSVLVGFQDGSMRGHPSVQTLHFRSSPDRRSPGDVEQTEDVIVEPGWDQFFRDLGPELSSGDVVVLLTSANNDARTQAVFEQVVVSGGKTLSELGVQLVPSEDFMDARGEKVVAVLREKLGIPLEAPIIAVDDNPELVVEESGSPDFAVRLPHWKAHAAQDLSDGKAAPDPTPVLSALGRLHDLLMKVHGGDTLNALMLQCLREAALKL